MGTNIPLSLEVAQETFHSGFYLPDFLECP